MFMGLNSENKVNSNYFAIEEQSRGCLKLNDNYSPKYFQYDQTLDE